MTRADALRALRFAGYHGDRAAFTRIYVGNRISLSAATAEFCAGERLREDGMRCGCADCGEATTDARAN